MSGFGIFILVLWSLMTCSFGFTMDRAVIYVPPAWDTAPSLDTYQRVFVDPAIKGKMQVTSMDRILQTKDAKISDNTLENQTREKKSTTENIKTEMKLIEMKPIVEIASVMKNDASDSSEENANAIITPRNVILLLIDGRGQDEKKENSWKDYKERLPFAIEGFLQNCHDKIESANFSMDNASIFEQKENNCDCERVLSNIGELLSWARYARGMTTGTVSSNNFSIPFFPGYEFNRSNKSNAKLELRKSKRDSNDGWQVIDFSDRARASSVSPLITTDSKTEGDMNYDVTWDIFDIFSKIRMAFFHSLLESLHKNDGAFKDELSHESFSPPPTATNLIKKTINELKSIPNDKGYMLVAAVPRSEGVAAVDLLQREASLKDTLLIVMQICVGNQTSVPFATQGPNCQILQEARIIDELPITIRKAMIISDCHDTGCTNRQRRDISIDSRMLTSGIFSQELPTRKRVIRNKNVEKPKTDKLNATTSNTVNTEETTIGKEIHTRTRNSASLKTIPCGFDTVLGVTISIFANVAMTSS